MAMPIIDKQLAKIVFKGTWKTNWVHVNLGTLMLDNTIVHLN
jgi:hypothetical protein